MAMRTKLEAMLASGHETALLRFSLGDLCLNDGEAGPAAAHLARAVELDPGYSAAWKLYGRALTAAGDDAGAQQAFARGIAVASQQGDHQAAKEMRVFARRLHKNKA